jgi:hypothetical protein
VAAHLENGGLKALRGEDVVGVGIALQRAQKKTKGIDQRRSNVSSRREKVHHSMATKNYAETSFTRGVALGYLTSEERAITPSFVLQPYLVRGSIQIKWDGTKEQIGTKQISSVTSVPTRLDHIPPEIRHLFTWDVSSESGFR